jgi:hypothetical protein
MLILGNVRDISVRIVYMIRQMLPSQFEGCHQMAKLVEPITLDLEEIRKNISDDGSPEVVS